MHRLTAHRDPKCKTVEECGNDSFESVAPTVISDRICSITLKCDPTTQWESKAPTANSNRECSAISVCQSGQFVSTVAGISNDLACSACGANQYQDASNHRVRSRALGVLDCHRLFPATYIQWFARGDVSVPFFHTIWATFAWHAL
jgi:hypothetical protein